MSFDIVMYLVIMFLLVVLLDLTVPLMFDRPSFSFCMWIGGAVDNHLLKPLARAVLRVWYQMQYDNLDSKVQRAKQKMAEVPLAEKWYWKQVYTHAIIERAKVYNRLCEVMIDVH